MFRDWEDYYLLVGSGAGALIGIMFVVATLTAGYEQRLASRGARTYITPIVFHFSVILVVSIVTAVPELPVMVAVAGFAVVAALGIAYSVTTTFRLIATDWTTPPDLEDKIFYGVMPPLGYLVLSGAALMLPDKNAVYAIGAAMLFLLLLGIRNAWDLAVFFVMHPGLGSEKSSNKKKK